MAGQRQPIELIQAKGKKHLTKAEIEKRKAGQIKAPANQVIPPGYLSKAQRSEFEKIAEQLLDIGIMSNLDCDALARYVQSRGKYVRYDALVTKTLAQIKTPEGAAGIIVLLEKLEGLRDKALKQCRAAAGDLGLTISSRCRLTVPQKEEQPESKWDKYQGAQSG